MLIQQRKRMKYLIRSVPLFGAVKIKGVYILGLLNTMSEATC